MEDLLLCTLLYIFWGMITGISVAFLNDMGGKLVSAMLIVFIVLITLVAFRLGVGSFVAIVELATGIIFYLFTKRYIENAD